MTELAHLWAKVATFSQERRYSPVFHIMWHRRRASLPRAALCLAVSSVTWSAVGMCGQVIATTTRKSEQGEVWP